MICPLCTKTVNDFTEWIPTAEEAVEMFFCKGCDIYFIDGEPSCCGEFSTGPEEALNNDGEPINVQLCSCQSWQLVLKKLDE